ncbi:hypothetical protein SAMN05444159_0247 [Bradyrhizobium lablabi]|uniref:Uncharacterized protein n=1 Tax=Bradyrhizobium lablabi TaxID=722472 RepID=A0A1M6I747_9BRAD|nr:hypothetical protein [Bradyrhizobium lablabi]SHJ30291.1 hypothetical protein SAMN05444159_0247 [Bradyrhizobium lablabi]
MSDAAPPQSAAASSLAAYGNLKLYDLQKPFVEPMLQLCRLTNTALDALFYDVGALATTLLAQGIDINTGASCDDGTSPRPPKTIDLSAATHPSGSIVIVDAKLRGLISDWFLDMEPFINHANNAGRDTLHTLAVTGVGSSAYGAVAFAWDVSKAIGEPVAAVVPGYGLADVVPQALGGWFGFEIYDALQSATQNWLASFAPTLAMMGKELALSTPGRDPAATGAPVYRYGSAASDDVHAILKAVPTITRLVGHSKGALAIENALRSLATSHAEGISVFTLGCVIEEEFPKNRYQQSLGWLDALGTLNSLGKLTSGGRAPERPTLADHSTNSLFPLSMQVGPCVAAR